MISKLILINLFLLYNAYSANILFVGDSHTAGPFGSFIKKNLERDHNVAVFGHSSSAAYHWINANDFKLSGGAYHAAHLDGVDFTNPNPTDWRVKVSVPKYKDFVTNMSYHSEWSKKSGVVKPDVAVIALGANDLRTIAKSDGTIIPSSYKMRQDSIKAMLKLVSENNMKCIWIGPPDSIKKPDAQQDTLYSYLLEVVGEQCDFYNSRHFKAVHCDGIHFNCNPAINTAKKWAEEVATFINSAI